MAAESECLNNYATEIADRVNAAWRRAGAKSVEAAEAYLEAGRLLLELRAECAYGAYRLALKRAGIPYRTAARLAQIARAGMDAETLAQHGIAAAARALAAPKGAGVAPSGSGVTVKARAKAWRDARRARGECTQCGAQAMHRT